MSQLTQFNEIDVVIKKAENTYHLYAPIYNCIVSDENLDTAYNKLVEELERVNQKKESSGFNMSKFNQTTSSHPRNYSSRSFFQEISLFISKLALLGVLLLIVSFWGYFQFQNKIPKLSAGHLLDKMTKKLDEVPEERKEKFHNNLRTLSSNLQPFVTDLKPLFDTLIETYEVNPSQLSQDKKDQ